MEAQTSLCTDSLRQSSDKKKKININPGLNKLGNHQKNKITKYDIPKNIRKWTFTTGSKRERKEKKQTKNGLAETGPVITILKVNISGLNSIREQRISKIF